MWLHATPAVARGANMGGMPDLAQPTFTDLSFLRAGDDEPCSYRVYEIYPENFAATCEQLQRCHDDKGRTVPLLRSHFALSCACLRAVPRHVPWLRASASQERDLCALREALVEPARRPGLISVDFVDYANALRHGGEIRLWRASGATAVEAASKLVRKIMSSQPPMTHIAACCMHMWWPTWFTMNDFDQMANIVEQGLLGATTENTLLICSALPWQRSDCGVSFMNISQRE